MSTRSVAGGWIAVVLALGVFVPVTADLSLFSAGSFDCGPLWRAGTVADDLSPVVDELCESGVRRRPWVVLATAIVGLLVLGVVRRATSGRPVVPARQDHTLRSSEVTLVVLGFAAPLTGLGIVLPFVLYLARRRDPRLAVPLARAVDCQLGTFVVGCVGLGLALSWSLAPGSAPLVAPGLAAIAVSLVVAARTIRHSVTGEAWMSRWRPLLLPSGWSGGEGSTSSGVHSVGQSPPVPGKG